VTINPRIGKGKVLPFEINGALYSRLGLKSLDNHDLVEAISNYRRALEKDPQNIEYGLSVAEVLTEMHRFEESNRILLPMLSRKDCPAECYFGIACNFIGMQDYLRAYNSFENYLALEPDGEYAESAMEHLDYLDDRHTVRDVREIAAEEAERETIKLSNRCKTLLEMERMDEAIQILEEGVEKYPSQLGLRNNLAMVYFCKHEYTRALEYCNLVLQTDKYNVQAKCNLAFFLRHLQDQKAFEEIIKEIRAIDTDDADDLNRISVVFLEIGDYENAFITLKKLSRMYPYDSGITHRMGYCYYKLSQFSKAKKCYDRLLKIDHSDTIAKYYQSCCAQAIQAGASDDKIVWMSAYQVPFDEMLKRVIHLNDEIKKPLDELKKKWTEDRFFRDLLKWSMELTDYQAKRSLLVLVAAFGDENAELFLREFQLFSTQPDSLKNEVLGFLKHMGAQEPYFVYLDGELVQSKVCITEFPKKNMPIAYKRMLEILFHTMQQYRSERCLATALEICKKYMYEADGYPKLHTTQIRSLAAALDYLAGKECKEEATKNEICDRYDVSLLRLKNAVARVLRGCGRISDEG